MALIEDLIKEKYLKTPLIIEAFRNIKRADFVLARRSLACPPKPWRRRGEGGSDDMQSQAELNIPLPIGFGQTISQPLTVAFMLELLQPEAGDKILDIGSGSGWVTALLAYIVSQNSKLGRVYSIERICELAEFAKKNVAKYNFVEHGIVEMKCADGTKGWAENAPYDKIHAAASAREMPRAWKDQLKIGGRLVMPVGNSVWLFIKKSDKDFEEHEFPGFAFVPLIGDS